MNTHLVSPYIELTTKCNLKCLHCYNESGEEHSELCFEDIENIYRSFVQAKVDTVAISGGEPTLHPDFLKYVEYFLEREISITIVTNATLISEEIVERLKGKKIGFQISLNASNSTIHDALCGKGSFTKTMQGIERLLENSFDIEVHSVLGKFNLTDVIPFIEYLWSKGITVLSFSTVNHLGRAQKNKDVFSLSPLEVAEISEKFETNVTVLEYRKKGMDITFPQYSNGCPLLSEEQQESIGIGPRIDAFGNVYLCQSFNKHSIGNIRKQNLYDLIVSENTKSKIQEIKDARENIKECHTCVWQYACGRGCPAEVLMLFHDLNAMDPYCSIRQLRFLNSLKQEVGL